MQVAPGNNSCGPSTVTSVFHCFLELPVEIQDAIWDAAGRLLHPDQGDVHYLTEEWKDSFEPILTSLKVDIAQSVSGLELSLWTACKASRASINRRFRAAEWYHQSEWPKRDTLPCDATTQVLMDEFRLMPFPSMKTWIRPRKDLVCRSNPCTLQYLVTVLLVYPVDTYVSLQSFHFGCHAYNKLFC